MNLRLMSKADIQAGMRLKDFAGWNQTHADWERFLDASPDGCFVAELEGRVAGTVTTIVYEGRVAWVGMVLVDPKFRRQGIGTRLLERAIASLDNRGVPTIKLDATPQGKPIYAKLGFVEEYEIERWTLARAAAGDASPVEAVAPELSAIRALDREVFGVDRWELLASLSREAPQFRREIRRQGAAAGYTFGRPGSRADHLGPWMARDETIARELLEAFLQASVREVIFVDCLKSNPWATALLREHGFVFSRPLTRMVRGPNRWPGRSELLGAILGPEFG